MDLRSTPTQIRGEVALLHGGKVYGYVDLYDVVGPMTKRQINQHYSEHRMPAKDVEKSKYRYGWKIRNVRVLKRPRKYDHPQGAQIWVNL